MNDEEQEDSSGAIDSYAAGTGTVEGNWKPKALIEAEQAVTTFDIAFIKIEELTGESDQIAIIANTAFPPRKLNGTIDEESIWGQAAILLAEAQEHTGMTLGEAEQNQSEQQSLFDEVQFYSESSYMSEADAAVVFAQTADAETKGDGNERVAMIIQMDVPVINSNGEIVYETRSVLSDTLEGQANNVIPQLFALYAGKGIVYPGATVSFIHTHPGSANEFSGEQGETIFHIANQAVQNYYGLNDTHFSYFLGDRQVPWLPKVDKMYLVSPTSNEIYACDSNGPIMSPKDPTKYDILAQYK